MQTNRLTGWRVDNQVNSKNIRDTHDTLYCCSLCKSKRFFFRSSIGKHSLLRAHKKEISIAFIQLPYIHTHTFVNKYPRTHCIGCIYIITFALMTMMFKFILSQSRTIVQSVCACVNVHSSIPKEISFNFNSTQTIERYCFRYRLLFL